MNGHDQDVPGSPLFGERQGLAIVLAFAFVLGMAATAAEPALAALRGTVQRLTQVGSPYTS